MRDTPTSSTSSHQAVRALHFIGSSPTPPKEDDLRKYLDKSIANTSDIVNRLKDRGLVGKRRSDKDERVVLLELSAQGREALRQHTLLDPTQLDPIVDKLSASERATFMALLEKMLGVREVAPFVRMLSFTFQFSRKWPLARWPERGNPMSLEQRCSSRSILEAMLTSLSSWMRRWKKSL